MDDSEISEMADALGGMISAAQSHGGVMDALGRCSKGEWFILRYLLEKQAPVLPSEIAEALGSSGARVSAALGSLEKKGLIAREIDTTNRRNILVTITNTGSEQISQMLAHMREYLSKVVTELGPEDTRELLRLNKRFFEIAGQIINSKIKE